jgi:hypothetical protein
MWISRGRRRRAQQAGALSEDVPGDRERHGGAGGEVGAERVCPFDLQSGRSFAHQVGLFIPSPARTRAQGAAMCCASPVPSRATEESAPKMACSARASRAHARPGPADVQGGRRVLNQDGQSSAAHG